MITKRFHNIFDLEKCNERILHSEDLVKFVEKIASSVDMKILEGPIVAKGIESNPGYSALAIIDYSHISVHTFTNSNEALVDIFSCKEYDRDKVFEVTKEFFGTPETIIRQKEVWWGE